MKELCPHIISVYGDFDENVDRSYDSYVSSTAPQPYAATDVAGYIHTLNSGNAILITDDLIPYLMLANLVQKHNLKTGDYVECQATFSSFHGRDLVVMVKTVRRVDYDDTPVVRATRHFTIDDQTVYLGRSILVELELRTNVYDRVDQILANVPLSAKKMVLSFDGRREDFNQEYLLTVTKPSHSSRDKLTQCLMCFFQAKEMVAAGEDVVLVIDSLDKMFTVFNDCMQRTGVIDPKNISESATTDLNAMVRCSACLQDKGTLTIIGLHHQRETEAQQNVNVRLHQLFDYFI